MLSTIDCLGSWKMKRLGSHEISGWLSPITTATSRIKARVAFIVGIEILLITSSFVYLSSYEQEGALIGNSINIAGKTRVLTATVLIESERYVHSEGGSFVVAESMNNLQSNIQLLSDGGVTTGIQVKPTPKSLDSYLQSVNSNLQDFRIQVYALTSNKTDETMDQVTLSGNKLIASADSLAAALGRYAKSNADTLLFLQIGLGILNISVHGVMFYLILRTLRPIQVLAKATRDVQHGNLDVSVDASGSDDIKQLGKSFNSMVISLRQSNSLLEAEKSRYQELYDGAPDLYTSIDTSGKIVECNQTFLRAFGYDSKQQIIGRSIGDFTAEQSIAKLKFIFEQWKSSGELREVEAWMKRRDGSTFPAAVSSTSIRDYDGEMISNTVIIDETDRYEARKALEQANEALKRADQLKSEFIAIASHELRTPIQPILGFVSLAKKGLVDKDKALEGIHREAQRLRTLASDILDVTRIDNGTLEYNFDSFSINDLLNQSILSATNGLTKQVDIQSLISATDGLMLRADRKRIEQAISNILANAIKFTDEGTIKVITSVSDASQEIQIEVIDSGTGISDEILPRLFTKFATTSDKRGDGKGSGLGLYICKAIIEAHGGKIYAVNNSNGIGTTFRIFLPVKVKEPQLHTEA